MTNGERYKIFKAWFESNRFPEMHESYKDAFWQGFEAGHRIASKTSWRHAWQSANIIAYRIHRDINSRANDDRLEQDLNECIGQGIDPAWNGDGLPPVGCECEVKSGDTFADYDWVKIKVAYSHMGELIGIVDMPGESIHNDMEKLSAGYCGAIFRPLRTEADKKSDEAIEFIREIIDAKAGDPFNSARFIYECMMRGKIPGVKLEAK